MKALRMLNVKHVYWLRLLVELRWIVFTHCFAPLDLVHEKMTFILPDGPLFLGCS